MKTFTAQAPGPSPGDAPAITPGTAAQGSAWAFTTAVILFGLNKGWEWIQGRTHQANKREDSELASVERIVQKSVENKDRLLSQLQEEYKLLLSEVIGRNDESLKNIQAAVSTMVQVQVTSGENNRIQHETLLTHYNRIHETLEKLDTATTRYLGEGANTNIRLYVDVREKVAEVLKEAQALHRRVDKHFGSDQG